MTKTINRTVRVDPFSAVPKYYQLAEILHQKIEDGDWQPHDTLPAERELETIYNVSRTTVRESLNYLEKRGFIYREHGKGTFVARPKMERSLHLLQSFTDDMAARGFKAGQRILDISRVAPPKRLINQLGLSPDMNQVLKIERLRLADDEPIGIHIAYLPLAVNQSITPEELETYGSLYALLEAKFNLVPYEASEALEAAVGNERQASLLKIEEEVPLFLLERTTFSQHREPMEFVRMFYRADRYKFYFYISR
jgi:GntR family transcriptional regulator